MNTNHLSDALECRDFEYLNDEFNKYEDFDAFYDAEYTNLMNSKHGIEVLAMACEYFKEELIMKLIDAAKQAKALYDRFLAEQNDFLDAHTDDLIDEEPEFDNEGYGPTGHWDEQSFFDYTYATDEYGEWINPYNTDF